MHCARWMAKVIHAIRTWLFRDQFQMTASEQSGVRDLATLEVIIQLKTPIGVETPLNGFKLVIELLKYTHEAFFRTASKKLELHLWYLFEELHGRTGSF